MLATSDRLNKFIKSPRERVSDARNIYIPILTHRKKTLRNRSGQLMVSDRQSSSKNHLYKLHLQKSLTHKTLSQRQFIQRKSKKHSKQQIKNSESCRVIVSDCSQDIEHYINVDGIKTSLDRFYPDAYYKSFPHSLMVDFIMAETRLALNFLKGQSIYLRTCRVKTANRVSLRHFEIIKPIGSGGFSKVYLVRFQGDGRFYALKLIDKEVIIKNKKKRIVMNERNIMEQISHPFIIDMKFAFETNAYLAFVLQYCAGGELFGLIRKHRRLSEKNARFYIIQILLGIAHLHQNGIVYRDIKPENILLSIQGHAKVADLGLAKPNMGTRQLAYSFCGSPEYMSPQMILQNGHSFPVDYYCMGALLYELLTGLPPFYSRDPNQIYEAVLTQDLVIPVDIPLTSQCKSLLKGLLCKDSKYRLGSIHGVKQILAHPWFGKNTYQKYISKQITPPESFESIQLLGLDRQLDKKARQQVEAVIKEQNQQKSGVSLKPTMKSFYYDYRNPGSHNKQNEKTEKTEKSQSKSIEKVLSLIPDRKISKKSSSKKLSQNSTRA